MTKNFNISNSLSDIRYVMRHEEEVLPLLKKEKRLKGLYIITEDNLGVADILADLLIYKGAFAYVIEAEHCISESSIKKEIKTARDIFGPVNGIIHLAGLKHMEFPNEINAWKLETQIQCKSFFQILQASYSDLENNKYYPFRKLISCSLMGGFYGRNLKKLHGLPIAGGGHGLLKSLEYEWNSILSKTIDFDLSLSPKDMARKVMLELFYGNSNTEVGYPLGKRIIFKTVSEPLKRLIKPKGLLPVQGSVILATGGARGITAETIKLLSNENNEMILIGRSELLERSHFAKYENLNEAQLRSAFINEARVSSKRITPAMIENKIRRTLSDREIRNNISKLRRVGNSVKYVSCDVADAIQFSKLIKDIYAEYGKIDIVVHGAGVIQDLLLRDKESTSFDKVFDTKVNSAFILYSNLDWKTLKAFVMFSSTAGRYGNKGQSDYAAANEVLNRLAWKMKAEHPNVVVKSLNWGPWTGVGMASEVVNDQFIDRGIIPIDVTHGTRYFIGELMHGDSKDVEIILGEGTWNPEQENLLTEIFNIDLLSINIKN